MEGIIGRTIDGRFRVEMSIGCGGMSTVYRALDLHTHQPVALKVLREDVRNDPEYRERFEREAQVNQKMNHPNIVRYVAAGEIEDTRYIAFEYVNGKNLKDVIREREKLGQEEAVSIAISILKALAHAHAHGIIHRDVKPQNIMISKDGKVKVADFGIAGMADTETQMSTGGFMGSVHYLSPEQVKEEMHVKPPSDLYSVGIILYEMLTGEVPFDGETSISIALKHLHTEPERIETKAEVSPAVASVIHKALEKSVDERYSSAGEMIQDLRRALRHPDGEFFERKQMRKKRRRSGKKFGDDEAMEDPRIRILFGAIALITVFLIGMIGVSMFQSVFLRVRMPDLLGVDRVSAERLLAGSGLKAEISYAYSDMTEGCVNEQIPGAGDRVDRNETVYITISRGSGLVTVQKYTGLLQDNAMTALLAQGFSLGHVTVVPSDLLSGTVIGQNPEAGSQTQIGSLIDLTVSGDCVVIPEWVGAREEDACARIQKLGLKLGTVTYETVSDARMDGVVTAQSLERFAQVLPGTTIDLTVGYYDKRKYKATVRVTVEVPEEGTRIRVTLVGEDGKESEMYAATHSNAGTDTFDVQLRSEQSGVMTWRLYVDNGFRSEATAVLQ